MARDHGRVESALWYEDQDWRALDGPAQRLYLMLISEPNITWAGTVALTVRRWAGTSTDSSIDTVMQSLKTLEHARYIAVDEDTEELLVRTFIKNNGVHKQPRVFMAAADQAARIASRPLRYVLASELSTVDLGTLTPVVRRQVEPRLKDLVTTLNEGLPHGLPHGLANGLPQGSAQGSTRVASSSSSSSSTSTSLGQVGTSTQETLQRGKGQRPSFEEPKYTDDQYSGGW
jgi:hypothetical protein